MITGVPLGYLLWRSRGVARALNPYLTTYYAIPVFVFYPLLLAIFGFNVTPIVIIAWAWGVVAVALSTAIGFGHVRTAYVKVGRAMNLGRWEIVRRIMFRAAVPYIMTGLKLGSIYSLIGVVASEFILATQGLGFLVAFSYNNFRPSEMYAGILLIMVLAIALNALLSTVERRLYARAA